MSKQLELANQQLLGYFHGKWRNLIGMIEEMNLTHKEWIKLKKDYDLYLDKEDIQEIEDHFLSLSSKDDIVFKSPVIHNIDLNNVVRSYRINPSILNL